MAKGRPPAIRNSSPVAIWLAAVSVCVDVAVVLRASRVDIYRCQDGYSNLTNEFLFSTFVIVIPVAAVFGHDLFIRNEPGGMRLAPRYLVGIVVIACLAIVGSLWLLRGPTEVHCD